MRCKVCQTEGHLFIFKGKDCCETCYDVFFEKTNKGAKNYPTGYTISNGSLRALWVHSKDDLDKSFMVLFDYQENTTEFVRNNECVFKLNEVKPATLEFIGKVEKHLRVWQVFS